MGLCVRITHRVYVRPFILDPTHSANRTVLSMRSYEVRCGEIISKTKMRDTCRTDAGITGK